MTTKQMGEPDLDSWRQQEKRQSTSNRNRRIGAIVAVAAVLVALLVVFGLSMLGNDDPQPAGRGRHGTPTASEPQTLSIVDVGSGAVQAALTAPATASEFDVSLDGSMIAYTDLDENGDAQVFVMYPDGSAALQLTTGEGGVSGADHTGPFWSPDGGRIAYARGTTDGTQMFVVEVLGSGSTTSRGVSTRVTQEPLSVVGPGGWTPDGGSIVFAEANPPINHYSARSVDLATGASNQLVADGSSPALSPDGELIAFNSWMKPDPLVQLIVADADGSNRHVIARLDGEDGYQRWSPDSSQIAYVETTGDGVKTYVYDLETGKRRFVTAGRIESWVDNDHILVS